LAKRSERRRSGGGGELPSWGETLFRGKGKVVDSEGKREDPKRLRKLSLLKGKVVKGGPKKFGGRGRQTLEGVNMQGGELKKTREGSNGKPKKASFLGGGETRPGGDVMGGGMLARDRAGYIEKI